MNISIIVPVHNAQNSIERCVRSILEQGIENIEIILVENNSSDNSLEVCKKLSETYKNILFLKTIDQGVSIARNKGLEVATGDIIGFCDADDFFQPYIMQYIIREIEQGVDLVVSGFYRVDSENLEKRDVPFLKNRTVSAEALFGLVLNDERVMGSVWNKFYKSQLLRNVRFDKELSYCEDAHFNAKVLIMNKKCRCKIMCLRTYNYVENPFSATMKISSAFDKQDRLKYINSYYKILNDCNLNAKQIREVECAIVGIAIDTLYKFKKNDLSYGKRKILNKEIRKNFWGFLKDSWKYYKKRNIRRWISLPRILLTTK